MPGYGKKNVAGMKSARKKSTMDNMNSAAKKSKNASKIASKIKKK